MNESDIDLAIQKHFCKLHARRVAGIETQMPDSIFDVLTKENLMHREEDFYYDNGDLWNRRNYEVYFAIAKHYRPETLLEIGVRFGYSLASMIKGAEASIKLAHGFDIDEYDENSLEVAEHRLKYLLRHELPKNVDLELSNINSQHLSSLTRSYDLISIDGDHCYGSKLHDLALTIGKCKVVVIDDYMEETARAPLDRYQPFFPIKTAVDEFVRQHKDKIKDHFLVESLRGIYIIEYKEDVE